MGVDDAASESDAENTSVRRRVATLLAGLGVLGLVLALAAGGGLWLHTERCAGTSTGYRRCSPTWTRRAGRRRPSLTGRPDPLTLLLVGSDTRAEVREGRTPGGRSDAIMLARLTADRHHAQVISIPRDSWVDIPGHGRGKINSSCALGGPTLLIDTVEQLTQVRIDHYVAIDFDGLIQLTDDLGGVDVVLAEPTTNGPYTFSRAPTTSTTSRRAGTSPSVTGHPEAISTASAASSSTCSHCS